PIDALWHQGELIVVFDYVPGVTLSDLVLHAAPESVAVAIMRDVLHGLQGAHEARDEYGAPLGIVHRDISPQNVLIGTAGIARVPDLGIGVANDRLQPRTDAGKVKGKLGYMPPEQALHNMATPESDVFAAGVVLWELLAGRRLFTTGIGSIDEEPIGRPG